MGGMDEVAMKLFSRETEENKNIHVYLPKKKNRPNFCYYSCQW